MRMTLQTDYALRLLMHLAVRGEELTTIAACAEKYSISKNHLMKVAHVLGRLGYVDAVRGRSGGLRLAHSPEDICLGDVVRSMEVGAALVDCFPGSNGSCLISESCRLKSVLAESLQAFLSVLDGYTLHDLVASNAPLRKTLSL